MLQRSPQLRTRRISHGTDIPSTKIWGTLIKDNLYPYNFYTVQHVKSGDCELRLTF